MSTNKPSPAVPPAPPVPGQETLENQLTDMSIRVGRSMVALIDTVAQRGGFRGEELSTVGQLRDQCSNMVQISEQIHSTK